MTSLPAIRHLLHQARDEAERLVGPAAGTDATVRSFQKDITRLLEIIESSDGGAAAEDDIARRLYTLKNACQGPLASLRRFFEDALVSAKTIAESEEGSAPSQS